MDLFTKGITNLELIHTYSANGKRMALISYQDITLKNVDVNNGYRTVEVPINMRPIQCSVRGNWLIDQSVKNQSEVSSNNIKLIE